MTVFLDANPDPMRRAMARRTKGEFQLTLRRSDQAQQPDIGFGGNFVLAIVAIVAIVAMFLKRCRSRQSAAADPHQRAAGDPQAAVEVPDYLLHGELGFGSGCAPPPPPPRGMPQAHPCC